MNKTSEEILKLITRRQFFRDCGTGMGAIALAQLLNSGGKVFASELETAASGPLAPKLPQFPAKAKRVIYMHMAGAPSQLDLFDHKPKLAELNGQAIPKEFIKGERFAFIKGDPKLLGSPYKFAKYGKCGAELSELLPHLSEVVDDIAIIKSMHTDQFNHAPAQLFVQTGSQLQGRPSIGSWVTYGLGTENQDLPGFVVLVSSKNPDGGSGLWSSGFLPSVYQGTQFRSGGDPVLFLSNPDGMSSDVRRTTLDAIHDLNTQHLGQIGDPEITTRINQYELAYRMQSSVPDLMDISHESDATREMYGAVPGKASFANNCLLARRLVERGVRFVQLYHWGWDSHGTNNDDDLVHGLKARCNECDRPSAALIKDLKQRGMLDDTLVVWGGEFGRTPMVEGRNGSKLLGRDHHPRAFSLWMAGGGIKGGITLGETDELGYNITKDPVHVHDLQATILQCLGMDHTKLTYRFQGRNFRLTDVSGEVVKAILA
jgi:hypothetical protein